MQLELEYLTALKSAQKAAKRPKKKVAKEARTAELIARFDPRHKLNTTEHRDAVVKKLDTLRADTLPAALGPHPPTVLGHNPTATPQASSSNTDTPTNNEPVQIAPDPNVYARSMLSRADARFDATLTGPAVETQADFDQWLSLMADCPPLFVEED